MLNTEFLTFLKANAKKHPALSELFSIVLQPDEKQPEQFSLGRPGIDANTFFNESIRELLNPFTANDGIEACRKLVAILGINSKKIADPLVTRNATNLTRDLVDAAQREAQTLINSRVSVLDAKEDKSALPQKDNYIQSQYARVLSTLQNTKKLPKQDAVRLANHYKTEHLEKTLILDEKTVAQKIKDTYTGPLAQYKSDAELALKLQLAELKKLRR